MSETSLVGGVEFRVLGSRVEGLRFRLDFFDTYSRTSLGFRSQGLLAEVTILYIYTKPYVPVQLCLAVPVETRLRLSKAAREGLLRKHATP